MSWERIVLGKKLFELVFFVFYVSSWICFILGGISLEFVVLFV